MECINKGNNSNAERALYLMNHVKPLRSIYITEIQNLIGHLASNFRGTYQDDTVRIRDKLDEYDKIYQRDNGASIV